jgi:hypothetical protein
MERSDFGQFRLFLGRRCQLPTVTSKNAVKNNIFCRYLLSKISWDFTITDISQTWVCETLDGIATKYVRKWLELPISATLSNIYLPYNKFGLNVILPSFNEIYTVPNCLTLSFKVVDKWIHTWFMVNNKHQ